MSSGLLASSYSEELRASAQVMPSASETEAPGLSSARGTQKTSAHVVLRGGPRIGRPYYRLPTRYGVTVNESMFSTLVVDCIAESMTGDVGSGVISPVVSLIL